MKCFRNKQLFQNGQNNIFLLQYVVVSSDAFLSLFKPKEISKRNMHFVHE